MVGDYHRSAHALQQRSIAMRITAISGLLLASLSPVVSAAPDKPETPKLVREDKAESGSRVRYTERDKPTVSASAVDGDWVELASPTPARHGREYISVDARYSHLRIDAHNGRPDVKRVRVVFKDDSPTRDVRVSLGPSRTAVIDLRGSKAIDHVVVISDPRSRGTYTVKGAEMTTGVAVR
jgi:hypothetical protein